MSPVPRRGICDNVRTAVDTVRPGKKRDINASFQAMGSHHPFEAGFCNPASDWEKGQVEKNMRDARHRLWQPRVSVPHAQLRFPEQPTFRDSVPGACR